jgi:hypothetical protein
MSETWRKEDMDEIQELRLQIQELRQFIITMLPYLRIVVPETLVDFAWHQLTKYPKVEE